MGKQSNDTIVSMIDGFRDVGTTYYVLDAVGSSGILKGKQKPGVTFDCDKQEIIDYKKIFKIENVQGLRSKSIKVVIGSLLFGQSMKAGLLFRKRSILITCLPKLYMRNF